MRRFFMPWQEVLAALAPQRSDVWVDIGCGPGYFTIPLASLVQKVYALDISERMIERVKDKAGNLGITNIEPKLSQENVLPLDDESVDGAFLVFVVHELDDPDRFFPETARILRKGGRAFVVEFPKENVSFGPPLRARVSKDQADSWASRAGLSPARSWKWSRSLFGWRYVSMVGWEYTKT